MGGPLDRTLTRVMPVPTTTLQIIVLLCRVNYVTCSLATFFFVALQPKQGLVRHVLRSVEDIQLDTHTHTIALL
jgi:hypothetical protein